MMELILYTVLHIKGNDANYKIYYHPGMGRYFFKPERTSLLFPSFYVWKSNGSWEFDNLSDAHIRAQVQEDMSIVGRRTRSII
jgi:hypothetical protein